MRQRQLLKVIASLVAHSETDVPRVRMFGLALTEQKITAYIASVAGVVAFLLSTAVGG